MPARTRRPGSAAVAGGRAGRPAGSAAARVPRRRGPASARAATGERVEAIQRSRLLAAAARTIDELGWADSSIGRITARAGVSRRTFYELFANREECLTAVLEDAVAAIGAELRAAELDALAWRERVRGGLWTILCFFDREPLLARVCVVGALSGGPEVLARREEVLAGPARVVDEGRRESSRGQGCTELTAEGLLGAAFAIVYARLLKGRRGPLTDLLGELMGMIVLPYLGPAAARREQTRPSPAQPPPAADDPAPAAAPRAGAGPCAPSAAPSAGSVRVGDPLESVPMRLTYRTTRVLEGVAENAGASNRQIADHAGIHDAGQVSKLLRRLERLGLLANRGAGQEKGEPNAWSLTGEGERLAQSIRMHSRRRGEAAR